MKAPFPPSRFLLLVCVFASVMATVSTTAHADSWEKIVSDSGRTVEINTSAIFDAEHGVKVSWGRIVLHDSEAKQAGYHTIKALNRYDCFGRSFTTVKRVYMDAKDNIIREESIPKQQSVRVRNNSVDEQIWSKVCGLPTASVLDNNRSKAAPKPMRQISKLADVADQAARDALATPLPKRALLPAAATDPPQAPASGNAPLFAQFKPIPMPDVPQTPVPPAAPRQPRQPTSQQLQEQLPGASPLPRRGSTIQPFILPAPATSPRVRLNMPAQQPAQPVHFLESSESWGYSGTIGPEFWGRMRPEWTLCAEGKRQSPIDFMAAKPITVDLDPVKFDYRATSFVIINGPRQLRVKVSEGMGMEVRGQRYALEGFTLHRPAETSVGNKIADMEAHFFHRGDKGRIAVLAVQFVRASQPSAPLQTLLNNLPLERGDSYAPPTTLDMTAFLPSSVAHYLYMGSLTTPPCTEGVIWVVMKEPMTLSNGQYEIFSHLHADNARPPQPDFGRLILETR